MSVLEALWMESIEPSRCPIYEDKEYRRQQKIQSDRADRFMATLSKEQVKAVIELEREGNALRFMEEQSLFVSSFKLGARMMLEVLGEA